MESSDEKYFNLGRGCRHLRPGHLDKWLAVYDARQKPIAQELINTLYTVCTPMVKTCGTKSLLIERISSFTLGYACSIASSVSDIHLLTIIKPMICLELNYRMIVLKVI